MKKIIKDEIYLDFYFSMLWLLRNRAYQTAIRLKPVWSADNILIHSVGIRDFGHESLMMPAKLC